jgi:hypothetical protein
MEPAVELVTERSMRRRELLRSAGLAGLMPALSFSGVLPDGTQRRTRRRDVDDRREG